MTPRATWQRRKGPDKSGQGREREGKKMGPVQASVQLHPGGFQALQQSGQSRTTERTGPLYFGRDLGRTYHRIEAKILEDGGRESSRFSGVRPGPGRVPAGEEAT